jgi:putative ABC transport system permease protein
MNTPLVLLRLSVKSLWSRRNTAIFIVLSLAMGVALVLGVEKLRQGARTGFANTISATDLVVGARSGAINLLLYSVFHVGAATNNVSFASYQKVMGHRDVAWTIPLSLGDSHRGYRVIGTNTNFFQHYRYGQQQSLKLVAGHEFRDLFDVVLGAEVARKLGYRLGERIVVSHGLGSIGNQDHDDRPFRVAGILASTGTPVDRGLYVSLAGIEAMHIDWRQGGPKPGLGFRADSLRKLELQPQQITAFLVGLKSRFAVFTLQREINDETSEPLMAVLPGVALQELWGLLRNVEWALMAIAGFVALSAILGMLAMLLAGLSERRREIAVLRSLGARPWQIFALIALEAGSLVVMGILAGIILLAAILVVAGGWLETSYGIRLAKV